MRLIIALLVLAIALVVAVAPAVADNPPGTGQPSQSCEQQPSGPPGFDTAGFAHAQTVYANVDGTPRVSQYDVACFQISQH